MGFTHSLHNLMADLCLEHCSQYSQAYANTSVKIICHTSSTQMPSTCHIETHLHTTYGLYHLKPKHSHTQDSHTHSHTHTFTTLNPLRAHAINIHVRTRARTETLTSTHLQRHHKDAHAASHRSALSRMHHIITHSCRDTGCKRNHEPKTITSFTQAILSTSNQMQTRQIPTHKCTQHTCMQYPPTSKVDMQNNQANLAYRRHGSNELTPTTTAR